MKSFYETLFIETSDDKIKTTVIIIRIGAASWTVVPVPISPIRATTTPGGREKRNRVEEAAVRWNVEIWFASISFLHLQLQFKMIVPKFFPICFSLARSPLRRFLFPLSLTRHKQEFNEKIISDDSFSARRNEIAGKTEYCFKELRRGILIFSIN